MRIGENDIHLTDTGGDKPVLFFVHGILMDHSVWVHQVAAFSSTHRVVCVDLRGFGASGADAPDISFEQHADDLFAVMEELDLDDVTVIGWSMGGAIAQIMGARDSDRIKRFVLVDTTPQLLASDDFPHALPVEAAQRLGALLAEDFAAGCAAFCSMIAPEDEAVAERLTSIAAQTDAAVAMAAFMSSGARNQLAELGRITVTTAIICGRNDAICLPAASERMAAAIPGCGGDVVWIEDAGHAPFLTRPGAFNAALRRIVSDPSPRP